MVRLVPLVLLGVLCLPVALPPRAAAELPAPGTRIRVTALAPEKQLWIGEFVANARDTLALHDAATNGALVTVPTLHVERFEISTGRHANTWRGAGIGFLAGAVLGGFLGYAGYDEDDYFDYTATETALICAGVFGVIGGTAGLVTGALTHTERWQAVPLEDLRGPARP